MPGEGHSSRGQKELGVFRHQKAARVPGALWGLGPREKDEVYRGQMMGGLVDPNKEY